MPTFSDVINITAGTTEATGTMNITGPGRIVELYAYSETGTGVVRQIRIDYPGIKTPQTYIMPVMNALEGTEAGSGQKEGRPIQVDIPIPPNISQITIGITCSAASQNCYVGVKWVAP